MYDDGLNVETSGEMARRAKRRVLFTAGAVAAGPIVALLVFALVWVVNVLRGSMHAHEAYMALLRGEDEEALRLHREALRLNQRQPEAWFNLGVTLARLDRFEEAIEAYERAAQLSPRDPMVLSALAETRGYVACGKEEYAAAERHYREALRHLPRAETWQGLGSVLHHLGRLDEAVGAHRTAQRLAPADAEFRQNLADVKRALAYELFEAGDYERSAAVYRTALTHAPDDAEAWCDLSAALRALKRFDEVREALTRARELDPDNESYAQMLDSLSGWQASVRGFEALERGEYEAAATAYREAVAHDPEAHEHWYNLSHALAALFLFEEARQAARRALKLDPDDPLYSEMLDHIDALEANSM